MWTTPPSDNRAAQPPRLARENEYRVERCQKGAFGELSFLLTGKRTRQVSIVDSIPPCFYLRQHGANIAQVTMPPPFVALGYLSGGANAPQRTQIRQVAAKFAGGGVAYRFVLGMPESAREHGPKIAAEAAATQDMLLLNLSDTPFRCALKYVQWFAWARVRFPTAAFIASGDDDAYVQLDHLEADLRRVHAQIGAVPALWGCIMWRAWYNNVTQDASTGFTGWTCGDGQAVAVRRGMEGCRREALASPHVRGLRTKAALTPDAPTCAAISANDHQQPSAATYPDLALALTLTLTLTLTADPDPDP
jgi:hypothetical protein